MAKKTKPQEQNNNSGLTAKQLLFVEEYLIDLNATQAAIRAGYSKDTAYSIGDENLKKPEILQQLTIRMDQRAVRTQITQDRVLQELSNIAFSNMRDYLEFGEDGITFKESSTLTDAQMANVAEVSQTKEKNGSTSIKFKLYGKDSALVNIMRHLGMFNDKTEVNLKAEQGVTNIQVNYNFPEGWKPPEITE